MQVDSNKKEKMEEIPLDEKKDNTDTKSQASYIEKESDRREDQGRHCYLGNRIDSILQYAALER